MWNLLMYGIEQILYHNHRMCLPFYRGNLLPNATYRLAHMFNNFNNKLGTKNNVHSTTIKPSKRVPEILTLGKARHEQALFWKAYQNWGKGRKLSEQAKNKRIEIYIGKLSKKTSVCCLAVANLHSSSNLMSHVEVRNIYFCSCGE